MKDAVVFNGPNALDFQDIRSNVARIPEVITRLRRAQNIWDALDLPHFDFVNFVVSEDRLFLGNIRLKSLAAAVVQLGLFDRYLKRYSRPVYLLGPSNGDSALRVACGAITFEELVQGAPLASVKNGGWNSPSPLSRPGGAPTLSGVSLTEYGVWVRRDQPDGWRYEELEFDKVDISKSIIRLIEEEEVQKFISVGPGNAHMKRYSQELALVDVQILESIDLDPMLAWFWPQMKEDLSAAGQ